MELVSAVYSTCLPPAEGDSLKDMVDKVYGRLKRLLEVKAELDLAGLVFAIGQFELDFHMLKNFKESPEPQLGPHDALSLLKDRIQKKTDVTVELIDKITGLKMDLARRERTIQLMSQQIEELEWRIKELEMATQIGDKGTDLEVEKETSGKRAKLSDSTPEEVSEGVGASAAAMLKGSKNNAYEDVCQLVEAIRLPSRILRKTKTSFEHGLVVVTKADGNRLEKACCATVEGDQLAESQLVAAFNRAITHQPNAVYIRNADKMDDEMVGCITDFVKQLKVNGSSVIVVLSSAQKDKMSKFLGCCAICE